ncbi:MAG TPA: EAL domain-containing protein, partial [Methylophilaceae bacterium]|nr:EAL domain-containing protein [Methylophilaceae bacterium]
AAIVTATITLAHQMQLKVIAEGVTSPEEIRFLADLDCDELQGYFFSEALPAQLMAEKLRRREWQQHSYGSRPLPRQVQARSAQC